jgi:hypothetical protein
LEIRCFSGNQLTTCTSISCRRFFLSFFCKKVHITDYYFLENEEKWGQKENIEGREKEIKGKRKKRKKEKKRPSGMLHLLREISMHLQILGYVTLLL